MFTLASGMAAPLASVTMPSMVARSACANRTQVAVQITNAKINSRALKDKAGTSLMPTGALTVSITTSHPFPDPGRHLVQTKISDSPSQDSSNISPREEGDKATFGMFVTILGTGWDGLTDW
jgi:hypothetical protein